MDSRAWRVAPVVGIASVICGLPSASGQCDWSPLGHEIVDGIRSLAVFDDGSGPALYAAGYFLFPGGAERIARWDGSQWVEVGDAPDSAINAIEVFDDGAGPALYAAGYFREVGGSAAGHIGRWDGTRWSPVGGGLNNPAFSLAAVDAGVAGGPALYVGGMFSRAGGVDTFRVARWDGVAWSPLGSGAGSEVSTMVFFDDGAGPALYAGGLFQRAGGLVVNGIAKWDGARWSALGGGMNVRAGRVR